MGDDSKRIIGRVVLAGISIRYHSRERAREYDRGRISQKRSPVCDLVKNRLEVGRHHRHFASESSRLLLRNEATEIPQ